MWCGSLVRFCLMSLSCVSVKPKWLGKTCEQAGRCVLESERLLNNGKIEHYELKNLFSCSLLQT